MNNKMIVGIVVVILLVGSLFVFFSGKSESATGATVAQGDTFRGRINNMAVQPGTLEGIGVYDKSCKMMMNGLTACDAGIETKEYGVLNLQYQHDMRQQPCLAPNDLVEVRILDAQGNAEIQRRY